MAIFTPSAIVGAISGKVGGVVFAKQKRAAVVRQAPRIPAHPIPSTSLDAADRRGRIRDWPIMDQEFRQKWNALALTLTFPNRLGINRQLSGFQLFMSNHAGRTVIPAANFTPVLDSAGAFPSDFTIEFTQGGTYIIDYTQPPVVPFAALRFYGARPYTSNPINFSNRFRFFFEAAVVSRPHDVTAEWEAIFGPVIAPERIGIQALLVSPTGRRFARHQFWANVNA